MLVGINYTQDGSRTIAFLYYVSNIKDYHELLDAYRGSYDEIYIVDSFDPNDQSFIDTVVTQGCRL